MKRRSFLGAFLAAAAAPVAIAKAVAAAAARPVPLYVLAPYIPLYTTPMLLDDEEWNRKMLLGYKAEDFIDTLRLSSEEIYRNTKRGKSNWVYLNGVHHDA
jgi:hypothetical protein